VVLSITYALLWNYAQLFCPALRICRILKIKASEVFIRKKIHIAIAKKDKKIIN